MRAAREPPFWSASASSVSTACSVQNGPIWRTPVVSVRSPSEGPRVHAWPQARARLISSAPCQY